MNNASHPTSFFRFCPHCGSAHFAPVSNKEFRCAQCGFNFFTNAAAAVAAIIVNSQGQIMLTRRAVEPNKGMLDLPGGFVDPDESVEDALRREIAEELGTEVTEARYLCSFPNRYLFSGCSVATIDLGFVCQIADYSGISAHDDIDQIIWLAPDQIDMNLVSAGSIRNILTHFINNHKLSAR